MSHRIFVALPISKGLQEKVASWQEMHGLGRRVRGRDLHVTLIPPWSEKKGEETGGVANVLGRLSAIPLTPFTMEFRELVSMPNANVPNLVWVAAEDTTGPPELYDLTASLERVLAGRMQKRDFEFCPHLTLTYCDLEEHNSPESMAHHSNAIDWKEEVTSFVLMESQKTDEGTRYEVLAEFPLK